MPVDQRSPSTQPSSLRDPLPEEYLGDGLVIRTLHDEADITRYCQIQTEAFSPATGASTKNLIRYHPDTCYADFILVEDRKKDRIASTVCLIPWRCKFEAVTLSVAMLEMVATCSDYRQLGLVRKQMAYYHRWADQRGFDLCIIEGIPYYYRQYGYTYAVDHRCYDRLLTTAIPNEITGPQDISVTPAALRDIPDLITGYQDAMASMDFYTIRYETYWQYLLTQAHYPVQVLKKSDSERFLGYFVPVKIGEKSLRVIDLFLPDSHCAQAVLRWLADQDKESLQLGWPKDSPLVLAAQEYGSEKTPGYQWLFRIPNIPAFLQKLGPVFEKRLASSGFDRLTRSFQINLFRCAYQMDFSEGSLKKVRNLGFVDSSIGCDGGDLCIPQDAFVRLLLGYRELAALYDAWPDIVPKPESLDLINVLFPPVQAHLSMPYGYWGPLNSNISSNTKKHSQ